MSLRCFLFSSDEGSSDVIRPVLTGLDVEGETCSVATTAVDRVAHEPFQLVIIDWDQQPEAGMILGATRERKPAERPLTLAIVSDDSSVPKALQAGANSILRKPLVASQVTDTLTTARDLIRSRQNATKPAQAAAAAASAASIEAAPESHLRAGEFLQSAPSNPGGQYVTESAGSPGESADEPINPLKELETVAAAAPPPLPEADEPKGLEWYLKKNGINRGAPAAAAPAPAPVAKSGPEFLGYEQPPSQSSGAAEKKERSEPSPQKEPALFSSYIDEKESAEPKTSSPSRLRGLKGPIIVALALAACAVIAAPQAPWHPHMKVLIARGQKSLHSWLNPAATTVVTQAPVAHEDFARPGDEYKLPVAENIPDATTDPSQIQVLPVVDPTAKKPAGDTPAPEVNTDPKDPSATTPSPDAAQPSGVAVPENPSVQPAPPAAVPSTSPAPVASAPASTGTAVVTTAPIHTDPPAVVTAPAVSNSAPSTPPPPRRQPAPYVPVTTKVPSSLKSQMAVMVPEASGNKPADAAMPSIEPVEVPELTERNLLAEQPPMGYPATAKGQQGTVILEVLIGRDGVVQDAKFLQGSLAFARTAIDGVRQWKFKPYMMNGRPVSVQTLLTVKFKPGQ
jgi:TonB family protein